MQLGRVFPVASACDIVERVILGVKGIYPVPRSPRRLDQHVQCTDAIS